MRNFFITLLLTAGSLSAFSQAHQMSKDYIPPADTAVQHKLSKWQDLKFGLFMHWGTYSQWGVVESWSICPEDEGWTQRSGPYGKDYNTYKKAYENLQTTFNPVKFNPDNWVKAAKAAGMKYVVFTTKHHDGFCMFDTKQTDYKITSPKTPFSSNPKANIAREVFSAFRKDNFMIGAYFSKPDWHSEYYWWPYFPPKDRNVNYDPAKHPEQWQKFKDYTFNQINELTNGDYGKIDILWFDGGWVRPKSTIDTSVDWQRGITFDQNIDMPRIAQMARKNQPGVIMVDRTVPGEFENYTTPEQQVPSTPLDHPWESCITMGNSWSFVPGDHYKSADEIISLLVKIVSRGGNLLMNIGVGPDGDWDPVAYQRLNEIADWIKVNGEGIYGTEAAKPYSEGPVYYTKLKNAPTLYAFVLPEKDAADVPSTLKLHLQDIKKVKRVTLLSTKQKLGYQYSNGELSIKVPETGRKIKHASAFKIDY